MPPRSKRRRQDESEADKDDIPPSDPDEAEGLEDAEQQDEDDQQEAEAGPSSNRQRAEYPRGTVKKVKVYNFMTYGTPAVEIRPGPRLNLVLGPNGTGKSSLVCALCLGLTGAPKLLGRADNVKDFIRRGADSGWVETTLSGGPGRPDKVIRCEMFKSAEGYSSRWKINGATRPKRDVVELVKDMNIQFDNLCQFLPQDKVVEFARLDPFELLIATEKAIGDSSLHDTHQQLIAKRDDMKEREQKHAAEQAAHDMLVSENQKLERDYQRFEKRRKLEKSIKVIQKKLAWMGVQEAQQRAKAADDEEIEKKRQLNEARKASKGDERPARQREQQAADARKQVASLLQEFKKQEAKLKSVTDKIGDQDAQVRQLRGEINGLEAESQKRLFNIEKMKKQLQLAQEKLDKFPPIPDHSAEVQELLGQQQELREQMSVLENDKVSVLKELEHYAREKNQRLASLREVASAAFQRMNYIVNSRPQGQLGNLPAFAHRVNQMRSEGLFRGQVVGPLGVEVKVRKSINGQPVAPNWVANLEQAIGGQMANFACQTRDDEKLLSEELRRAQLNTVKVIVVTHDISADLASSSAQLAQYSVAASLNELFDAPQLVRHALNNVCNLDGSYIMTSHDLDAARALMEAHRNVRRVYSPQQAMAYQRSAYGGREDAYMKTESLMPSRILAPTGAATDLDERKWALEQQVAALDAKVVEQQGALKVAEDSQAGLQAQLDELVRQAKALTGEENTAKAAKRKLQSTVAAAQKLLEARERAPDPLAQAPALQAKLKAALKKHHTGVAEAVAATGAGWQLLQDHVVAELHMRELDMQARAMLAHFEAQRRAVSVFEAEHRNAVARAKALTEAFRRAKETAEEEHPLDAAARSAFQDLPDDREELASELAELERKVDEITVSNPRVAQEYRARKDQIESKARDLAELQAQLDTDSQELELLKTWWLLELQRVVGLINSSFSTNFSEIGCAGEVHLAQHEDYDKFSIQIKVKFREDEELQQLTAHRQSGGERSVSTILYLIALQGVTVTPFRVVDEINQGMDPANERKVFEQLVTASCKEGTPQCFLLTPKLLPDLPFTQDITVLNIFNGGAINEQVATNFSATKLFGSTKMGLLQQWRSVPVAG